MPPFDSSQASALAEPSVLVPATAFATRQVSETQGQVVIGNAVVHASLVADAEQLRAIAAHITALADSLVAPSGLVLPDGAGKIIPGGRS